MRKARQGSSLIFVSISGLISPEILAIWIVIKISSLQNEVSLILICLWVSHVKPKTFVCLRLIILLIQICQCHSIYSSFLPSFPTLFEVDDTWGDAWDEEIMSLCVRIRKDFHFLVSFSFFSPSCLVVLRCVTRKSHLCILDRHKNNDW